MSTSKHYRKGHFDHLNLIVYFLIAETAIFLAIAGLCAASIISESTFCILTEHILDYFFKIDIAALFILSALQPLLKFILFVILHWKPIKTKKVNESTKPTLTLTQK